eukprot:TRINITY_DN35025_c0_g1_i1.p1 TRINITY_DN35025_c0_g1~~TRINITY_DN35025_c0_g1_i1.p1  ORF type:complete len:1313 (-),score=207.17 TRINITY_DN35025_c0_g1_i1:47-3985(-)
MEPNIVGATSQQGDETEGFAVSTSAAPTASSIDNHGGDSSAKADNSNAVADSKSISSVEETMAAVKLQSFFRGQRQRRDANLPFIAHLAKEILGGGTFKDGKFHLSKQQYHDAEERCMGMSAGIDHANKTQMGLWETTDRRLSSFGSGICLHFSLARQLAIIFFLASLVSLPNLCWNYMGDNLSRTVENVEETMVGHLAMSMVGNMGNWVGVASGEATEIATTTQPTEAVGRVECFADTAETVKCEERRVADTDARDFTFISSALDFLVALVILGFSIYFREVHIPRELVRQHKAVASPEDWAIYVDKLPRRLPGEDHQNYEALLRQHFENILCARVNIDNVSPGLRVVRSGNVTNGNGGNVDAADLDTEVDISSPLTERRSIASSVFSCSVRRNVAEAANVAASCLGNDHLTRLIGGGYDHHGRLIGNLRRRVGWGTCEVHWLLTPEQGEEKGKQWTISRASTLASASLGGGTCTLEEVADLRDARLLGRLDAAGISPDTHWTDVPLIHSVHLVHDFGRSLSAWKKEHECTTVTIADAVRKARKKGNDVDTAQLSQKVNAEMSGKSAALFEKLDRTPIVQRDVIGAFVILTRSKHRDFLLREYRFSQTIARRLQSSRLSFFWHAIRVTAAPAPSDVNWFNLDFSVRCRGVLSVIATIINIALLFACIAILARAKQASLSQSGVTVKYCNTMRLMNDSRGIDINCNCTLAGNANLMRDVPPGIRSLCSDFLFDQAEATAMRTASPVAVAVINVLIGPLNIFLADLQKPLSVTQMSADVMGTTAIFQVVNLAIIVVIVNADFKLGNDSLLGRVGIGNGTFDDLYPKWYFLVGSTVLLASLTNSISSPSAGIAQAFLFRVKRWLLANRQMLRQDLLELYVPPDFPIDVRAAQLLSMTYVVVVFAGAMPALWLFGAISAALFYWCDKIILLYGSKTPTRFSEMLVKRFLQRLDVAILIHGGLGIFVWGNQESSPSYLIGSNTTAILLDEANARLSARVNDFVIALVNRQTYYSTWPQFVLVVIMLVIYLLRLTRFLFGNLVNDSLSILCELIAPKTFEIACEKLDRLAGVEEDPSSILQCPYSGRPIEEIRSMNRLFDYDIQKIPSLSFLANKDTKWTAERNADSTKRDTAMVTEAALAAASVGARVDGGGWAAVLGSKTGIAAVDSSFSLAATVQLDVPCDVKTEAAIPQQPTASGSFSDSSLEEVLNEKPSEGSLPSPSTSLREDVGEPAASASDDVVAELDGPSSAEATESQPLMEVRIPKRKGAKAAVKRQSSNVARQTGTGEPGRPRPVVKKGSTSVARPTNVESAESAG